MSRHPPGAVDSMSLEDPTASAVILGLCMIVFLAIPIFLVTSGQRSNNAGHGANWCPHCGSSGGPGQDHVHPSARGQKKKSRRSSRANSLSCGAHCEHVVLVAPPKAGSKPASPAAGASAASAGAVSTNSTARRGSGDGEVEMAVLRADRADIAATSPHTPATRDIGSVQREQQLQLQQEGQSQLQQTERQSHSHSPTPTPTNHPTLSVSALDLTVPRPERDEEMGGLPAEGGGTGTAERAPGPAPATKVGAALEVPHPILGPRKSSASAGKQVRFHQSPPPAAQAQVPTQHAQTMVSHSSSSDAHELPSREDLHGDEYSENMSVSMDLPGGEAQQQQAAQQGELTAVYLSELIPPVSVQEAQGPAVIEDEPFHRQSDNFARAELEPTP